MIAIEIIIVSFLRVTGIKTLGVIYIRMRFQYIHAKLIFFPFWYKDKHILITYVYGLEGVG